MTLNTGNISLYCEKLMINLTKSKVLMERPLQHLNLVVYMGVPGSGVETLILHDPRKEESEGESDQLKIYHKIATSYKHPHPSKWGALLDSIVNIFRNLEDELTLDLAFEYIKEGAFFDSQSDAIRFLSAKGLKIALLQANYNQLGNTFNFTKVPNGYIPPIYYKGHRHYGMMCGDKPLDAKYEGLQIQEVLPGFSTPFQKTMWYIRVRLNRDIVRSIPITLTMDGFEVDPFNLPCSQYTLDRLLSDYLRVNYPDGFTGVDNGWTINLTRSKFEEWITGSPITTTDKFRFWDMKEQRIIYPVTCQFMHGKVVLQEPNGNVLEYPKYRNIEIHRATNFTDKNGVVIYDGDIVRHVADYLITSFDATTVGIQSLATDKYLEVEPEEFFTGVVREVEGIYYDRYHTKSASYVPMWHDEGYN